MQDNIFKKSLVVGIIILFVGASVIPSMGNSIVVKHDLQENRTTFKDTRSGGYIQGLIDNASDGDTIYIPSGIYYENIIINKSISLVGEDKDTTIIDGGWNGDVVSIYADWVNISGFTIQNCGEEPLVDAGIWFANASNCSIIGNIFTHCSIGVATNYTGDNLISGCFFDNCSNSIYTLGSPDSFYDDFSTDTGRWTYYGDAIRTEGYLQLTPNENGKCGQIWFDQPIFRNFSVEFDYQITSGADGLVCMFYKQTGYIPHDGGDLGFMDINGSNVSGYGIEFDHFYNHEFDPSWEHIALIKDTVGNHLVWEDDDRVEDGIWHHVKTVVDTDDIYVFLDDMANPLFIWNGEINRSFGGFGFSASTGGATAYHRIDNVKIYYGYQISNGNHFFNNTIVNADTGFYMEFSSGNIIANNTIFNNSAGIIILDSSNNTISDNTISNNNDSIYLNYSSNNIITDNNISNNQYGIYLAYSSGNNITGNTISNNRWYGILLDESYGNNITDNNIISNNDCGVLLQGHSHNNTVADNICYSNNISGIYLEYSDNNIISGNNCSSNIGYGIHLKYSSNCVIDGNIVNDNKALYESNVTGLVGYWKMDEPSWNGTLGEVLESSGNGNNGTAMNGVNTTEFGLFGRAGEFDGIDDYVEVPNIINGLNAVTIEAWFNYVDSNTWRWIYGGGPGFNYNPGMCIVSGWNVMCYHWRTTSDSFYGQWGTITIIPNTWYHIAYIYDGSTIKSYINGLLDFSGTSSGIIVAPLTQAIGAGYWDNNECFYGYIDDVKIYNRSLSAEEVIAHYNQFIATDGIHLEQSENNIITNNTCQGNKYGINLYSSSNSNIVNKNACLNNQYGINLNSSSNSNIVNNNICLNNQHGIHLNFSSNSNTITYNSFNFNKEDGIHIVGSCRDTFIADNNISSNHRNGIHIFQSRRNNIEGNIISSNGQDGLYLNDSNSNTIRLNIISNNNDNGICLNYYSDHNDIINNTISSNEYGIIQYYDSYDNNIYHNNLINNNQNGYDPYSNNWYNALFQEGNYWSDYTGIDFNSDGIGDTPYNISGGSNQDLYPFMEPDGWLKEPEFRKALIFGKITNLIAAGKYITFESVKTRVITFKPFSFHKYISGEKLILSKNYLGLIGVRYILALCEIMVRV